MRFDEISLFYLVLEGQRSPEQIDSPYVGENLVGIFKFPEVVLPVLFIERVINLSDLLGILPFLKVDPCVLERALLTLFPDLCDRAPDDIHQLVPEDEAPDCGNQQGQDDSCDAHPEVLEVLEERLFGRGITLIPELKDFLQEEHPQWADWFSGGIHGGREPCCPYFRADAGGGA